MRVVVLGGTGLLGRALVSGLMARGVDVASASRRSGVDVENGAGLADVLLGADVVVHAATSPLHPERVDLGGTRRLVAALQEAGGSTHLVYVSIVGCDLNPYPYYRVKAACEQELERGRGRGHGRPGDAAPPARRGIARAVRPLGLGLGVRGVAAQPCDVGWVARRLADVATGPRPHGFTRTADLAGPDLLPLAEAVRLTAAHDGVRLRGVVMLPALGRVARSFAAGTNLPGPGAETGGRGFAEWLAGEPAG